MTFELLFLCSDRKWRPRCKIRQKKFSFKSTAEIISLYELQKRIFELITNQFMRQMCYKNIPVCCAMREKGVRVRVLSEGRKGGGRILIQKELVYTKFKV